MNVVDVVAPILYLTYPVRCTPHDIDEPCVYVHIQSVPDTTHDDSVPISKSVGLNI